MIFATSFAFKKRTLGRKGLKHINGIIIYDLRITSDEETRVEGDGTYSRYLYPPWASVPYELKSCFLFIIHRAIASLIKLPLHSQVIKSPFEFVEYRLKIASRWHILIRTPYTLLFSIIVQHFQLKQSDTSFQRQTLI